MIQLAKRVGSIKQVKNLLAHRATGDGPINFIDVGSAGNLPKPWIDHPDQIGEILKFEPRGGQEKHDNITMVETALWSAEETRPLYIYNYGEGVSLYKQNYDYVFENFEQLREQGPENLATTWFERSGLKEKTTIDCQTLDGVLNGRGIMGQFDFLKIDAQGAEYEILKGGEEYLQNHCLGLHLELFTIPLYEDILLLPEVESYLEELGYELVTKMPAHGTFNSQHDCLFLHEDRVDGMTRDLIETVYS